MGKANTRLAAIIVALLRDPARRVTLGQAARTSVAARFDWATIMPGLEAVFSQVTA